MKYPLSERIGNPKLLVGRGEEFDDFYKWIDGIPDMLSMSRVILARRKSGKTSMIQRIFNRLWSENGPVIPFFISIPEAKIWFLILPACISELLHLITFLFWREMKGLSIISCLLIRSGVTVHIPLSKYHKKTLCNIIIMVYSILYGIKINKR